MPGNKKKTQKAIITILKELVNKKKIHEFKNMENMTGINLNKSLSIYQQPLMQKSVLIKLATFSNFN